MWDQRAWAAGPNDLTKAVVTHWLMGVDTHADGAQYMQLLCNRPWAVAGAPSATIGVARSLLAVRGVPEIPRADGTRRSQGRIRAIPLTTPNGRGRPRPRRRGDGTRGAGA